MDKQRGIGGPSVVLDSPVHVTRSIVFIPLLQNARHLATGLSSDHPKDQKVTALPSGAAAPHSGVFPTLRLNAETNASIASEAEASQLRGRGSATKRLRIKVAVRVGAYLGREAEKILLPVVACPSNQTQTTHTSVRGQLPLLGLDNSKRKPLCHCDQPSSKQLQALHILI